MTRRFDISGTDPYKIWTPRQVNKTEMDNMPRCVRCSKRCKQSLPVEGYNIEDAGDNWIDVKGTCKGRCDNVLGEPTEHPSTVGNSDNWHDYVHIEWRHFSDAKEAEMLGRELTKQIAAIRFFDDQADIDEAA